MAKKNAAVAVATEVATVATRGLVRHPIPEGHRAVFGNLNLFLEGSKAHFLAEDIKGSVAKVARVRAGRVAAQQAEFDAARDDGFELGIWYTIGMHWVPTPDTSDPVNDGSWQPQTVWCRLAWNNENRGGLCYQCHAARQPVREESREGVAKGKGDKVRSTYGFTPVTVANSGAITLR